MFGGQIMRDRARMDEPTIDCWCGKRGRFEIRLEVLNDQAAWQTYFRKVVCRHHLTDSLEIQVWDLDEHARAILMPL